MIAAIIQARTGSTRLPNKVFKILCGKPLIWHITNRLRYSQKIDKIILATTLNQNDNILEDWAFENEIPCFRGSEDDVLDRYYHSAQHFAIDTIVRITSDDPFKDPDIIDGVIKMFLDNNLDFAYNNYPPSFPEGLDTEVFSFNALERAHFSSRDAFEREHVTQYFYRHPEVFRQMNFPYKENISNLRWTIDTTEDLEMAKVVFAELYHNNPSFRMEDILMLLHSKPEIAKINSSVNRSTMYHNSNPNE